MTALQVVKSHLERLCCLNGLRGQKYPNQIIFNKLS